MDPFKGKATASMVLGIISCSLWIFGYGAIAAIVCGIIGLVLAIQVRKGYEAAQMKPTGIATAGLVLSLIGTALSAIIFISCIACATCIASSVPYSSSWWNW
ncbi:MAG: hypothetical protein ACOYJC_03510 [Christensenellales bacterium]|jgi:hypothetical protein